MGSWRIALFERFWQARHPPRYAAFNPPSSPSSRHSSRRRIERLMRDMGLQAQRGQRHRPQTTNSRHDLPIAPNLLGRSFVAERPDAVWLGDISYIPTDEGFLYLTALKDLATREIVGWAMADHLRAGLCIDALIMALQRCHPPRGLIHHSDRGVQPVRLGSVSDGAGAARDPTVDE